MGRARPRPPLHADVRERHAGERDPPEEHEAPVQCAAEDQPPAEVTCAEQELRPLGRRGRVAVAKVERHGRKSPRAPVAAEADLRRNALLLSASNPLHSVDEVDLPGALCRGGATT